MVIHSARLFVGGCLAGYRTHFPTRFVDVQYRLQSDQFGNRVALLLPVVRQLTQQRVGLRLRQIQPREEVHDLNGVVLRHAHPIMQEGQNQNHFDPELTATAAKSGRQRQSGRTRQIANIVTQIGGFPVDDSPRERITMVNTLLASDSVREDFDGVPDEVCFRTAWLATGRSFFLPAVGILRGVPVATEAISSRLYVFAHNNLRIILT